MEKRIRFAEEINDEPRRRTWVWPSLNPAYPVLLALVVVVGAAQLFAWYSDEFSLEHRAERGQPTAQYLLGKRYFETAVSPRDYLRAARWIRRAADQGYAKAQTGMGLLYENGFGVPKSYDTALLWLGRAAAQGFPVAQNELGVMYAKGRGVSRDMEEATKWCRRAAVQGSEIARRNFELAEIAKTKTIPELKTSDNKSYRRVILQRVEADGITVSFIPTQGGLGVAKLKLDMLPGELRQLCGYAAKTGTDLDSAYAQLGSVATTL